MQQRILVTGATGNVGMAVIRHLTPEMGETVAAVRNVEKSAQSFSRQQGLSYTTFDFDKPETFSTAFQNIDVVFLLRPPHLSDVAGTFVPMLDSMKHHGVRKIVFLSVQGVETSKLIPHNRIESAIRQLSFDYVFLRPSYFMQNLTTALLPDIKNRKHIALPAGDSKFNWIDVEDIGEAAARVIESFNTYKNTAFDLTGLENTDFSTVASILSEGIGERITYINENPIRFYMRKTREGLPAGMARVMVMLHFLPRFQREPRISNFFEQITGRKPVTLRNFIAPGTTAVCWVSCGQDWTTLKDHHWNAFLYEERLKALAWNRR